VNEPNPQSEDPGTADASPGSVSADIPAPDSPVATDVEPAETVPRTKVFEDLPDVAEAAVAAPQGAATLELLYDLSLPLTVELGRATLKVQDVLALGQGSVVRLDRIAGDPVDVYVGAKKLAQAEVVVLDDKFGIRITHIYPDANPVAG
jgi:flagellar motor switch protein FliN/FliY